MKVELLNPEETKNIFEEWGSVAAICYNTKTDKYENIGKHCMSSGHTSGSRGTYIKFKVSDVPRHTIDQIARHEVGVFKNIQSFRYVNKDNFNYEIPEEIKTNEILLNKYISHMNETMELYSEIQFYVGEKTNSKERANEQARYLLPMSTHSAFVIGFDIEALIHFMHKRLCTRAEDITRQVAIAMKNEVLKVVPELKDELEPQCRYLMWCPEEKGCGAYPSKQELKDKINHEIKIKISDLLKDCTSEDFEIKEIKNNNSIPKIFFKQIKIPVWKIEYTYRTEQNDKLKDVAYITKDKEEWDCIENEFNDYINEKSKKEKIYNAEIKDIQYLGNCCLDID